MSGLPRINPQEVIDAYLKNKLQPLKYGFALYGTNYACPVGALTWHEPTKYIALGDADIRYGWEYVDGFTRGFDGHNTALGLLPESERFLEGLEDGRKCIELVKEKLGEPISIWDITGDKDGSK